MQLRNELKIIPLNIKKNKVKKIEKPFYKENSLKPLLHIEFRRLE